MQLLYNVNWSTFHKIIRRIQFQSLSLDVISIKSCLAVPDRDILKFQQTLNVGGTFYRFNANDDDANTYIHDI